MRQVKTEEAIGKPLAHDIIRYGPGTKTVLFKRGHVVQAEDVERLKDAGNYSVYIAEGKEEKVHEDEAAIRMARAAMGKNLSYKGPDKGSINMITEKPGLLKVKADILKQVNLIDDFVLVASVNNTGVKKGAVVGAAKIVPLTVDESRMRKVEEILEKNKPVLEVIPPKIKKIGAIITGTEVYEGRVKDAFKAVLREKLKDYDLDLTETVLLPDDEEKIRKKIIEFKEKGHELILVTSGMAVDSGDLTPNAIRTLGQMWSRAEFQCFRVLWSCWPILMKSQFSVSQRV